MRCAQNYRPRGEVSRLVFQHLAGRGLKVVDVDQIVGLVHEVPTVFAQVPEMYGFVFLFVAQFPLVER